MRVGIITFGGDGGKSGISHYIIKLLREFSHIETEAEFEVIVYENEQSVFIPANGRLAALTFGSLLRNPVVNVAWHQIGLPFLCKKRGYDILFLPAANRRMPYWVPCPTVGTVHDFSSTHVKDKYDPARMIFIKKLTPILIRRLDMILTVSENSKKDIIDFCGIAEDRIVVTPNGVDVEVYNPLNRQESVAAIETKYKVERPFILYVSRIEHPGKNHVTLIRAFNCFKDKTGAPHKLILAGSKWSRSDEVEKVAEASPHVKDIRFIGFVDDADLPHLYRAAELFAFPSLYEGFGIPILEAMASGTPVICSNVSSMPEVAGDAALLFDPRDEFDMCSQMERIIVDREVREGCIEKGLIRAQNYSWAETAIRTLDVIISTWKSHQ
jgi:glycosyltransferase involved in cell wall biosynthesis